MRAMERPPYTWACVAPAELNQVLERLCDEGVACGDRALLLAVISTINPRDLTSRARTHELRRLAGERTTRPGHGGGHLNGGLWRLQRLGLVAHVNDSNGPGWMLSPEVMTTGGDPARVRQRWLKFAALRKEGLEIEQQRFGNRRANAEQRKQQRQQAQPELLAAAV